MSHLKKRPEDLRTKRHMLLLTEAEHAQYTRLARDSRLSLNEWIRYWLPSVGSVGEDRAASFVEDPIT